MREKLEAHAYSSVDAFEADFEQMIRNCLDFNDKETTFYKQGIRMRDQGGVVLRAARRMAQRIGFDGDTGLHLSEKPSDVPQFLDFDKGYYTPSPSLKNPTDQQDKGLWFIVLSIDDFLKGKGREGMPLEEQLRCLVDRLDLLNAAKPSKLPFSFR